MNRARNGKSGSVGLQPAPIATIGQWGSGAHDGRIAGPRGVRHGHLRAPEWRRVERPRSATKPISTRRSAAPDDVARPIYDEVPQAIFICKKAVFFQRKELHWSPPSRLNRRLSRERAHDKHSEKTWRSCSGCNRMRTNARSVGRVERRQSSLGEPPGEICSSRFFWGPLGVLYPS